MQIRQAIAGPVRDALGDLWEVLHEALAPIMDSDQARLREPDGWDADFDPQRDDHPGTFWADLTHAEADDLARISSSIDLDRLARQIADDVVAAALAFAARHPDLPRGRYVVPDGGAS